jgi:O-antigen ligase
MAIAVIMFVIINHRRIKELTKGISIAIAGFLVFVAISWAWYGFEGIITNAVNRVLLSQKNAEIVLEEEIEGNDDKAIAAWVQIESDDIRTERLHAVYKQIKDNWVLGSGFGQELKVRNYGGKIEYTYLDVLSKMGVFGFMSFLLVLLMPFLLVYRKYKGGVYSSIMGVMLCVMICIYIASIFNPFITSPIGFSLLAVTAALIYALKTGQVNEAGKEN